jgi:hypothetical protein
MRAAQRTTMYLLSWIEEEARVEASLGGRVTCDEMSVLFEELREVIETVQARPYLLQLDYSKARSFDTATLLILNELKDFCLANGAAMIATILEDEDDLVTHTSVRLQQVMEGSEQFVLDPTHIDWTRPAIETRIDKVA